MANTVTAEEVKRLQEIERKQKERYKKQNEHTNKLYDRISFTVPKGRKKDIEAVANANRVTLNKFISEMVLGILDNNDVINAILNNNIQNLPNEEIKNDIKEENKTAEKPKKQETKARTKQRNTKTEAEKLAEVQAMIDAKRAEEERRKAEREAEKERQKQQEAEELANGIRKLQQEQKERQEKELEEDRAKFEQFEDIEKIRAMLQDVEFRKCIENPIYKDAFVKHYGINNYNRIQEQLKVIQQEEKEDERKQSIKNNCPF